MAYNKAVLSDAQYTRRAHIAGKAQGFIVAESTGFHHITVVAPDEDEIVIQAGSASAQASPVPASPAEGPGVADVPAAGAQSRPVPPAVAESQSATSPAPVVSASTVTNSVPADVRGMSVPAAQDSGIHTFSQALHSAIAEERAAEPHKQQQQYHETTLDDLKHESMSSMQRSILVILVALAILFIVYCIFGNDITLIVGIVLGVLLVIYFVLHFAAHLF